jgi:hypothetical protein
MIRGKQLEEKGESCKASIVKIGRVLFQNYSNPNVKVIFRTCGSK